MRLMGRPCVKFFDGLDSVFELDLHPLCVMYYSLVTQFVRPLHDKDT